MEPHLGGSRDGASCPPSNAIVHEGREQVRRGFVVPAGLRPTESASHQTRCGCVGGRFPRVSDLRNYSAILIHEEGSSRRFRRHLSFGGTGPALLRVPVGVRLTESVSLPKRVSGVRGHFPPTRGS